MTQQKQKNNKEIEEKKPLYTPIKYILTSVIDCTQNSNVQENNLKSDDFFFEKDEFDYIFHELNDFDVEDQDWKDIINTGAGIKNTNNNCYLSSILQILYYCPFFMNILEKIILEEAEDPTKTEKFQKKENFKKETRDDFNLIRYLKTHMKAAQNKKVLVPTTLLKNIGQLNQRFTNDQGGGQDAYLFLKSQITLSIKDYFNSSTFPTLKMKETCPLSCIFSGKYQKVIECPKCQTIIENTELFMDIPIDIETTNHLQNGINNNLSERKVSGFLCSNCKNKVDGVIKTSITKAPGVLCLYIRRWGLNTGVEKNKRHQNYQDNVYQTLGESSQKYNYELFGQVLHHGDTIKNGHYTSVVKGSNKLWMKADDESVKPFSINKIDKSEILMLFYRIVLDTKEQKKISVYKNNIYGANQQPAAITYNPSQNNTNLPNKNTEEEVPKVNDIESRKELLLKKIQKKAKKQSNIDNDILQKREIPRELEKAIKKIKLDNQNNLPVVPKQKKLRLKKIGEEFDFLEKGYATWETEGKLDKKEHKQRKEFLLNNTKALQKNVRERDEYDAEYDLGRLKKVRNKTEKVKNDFDGTHDWLEKEKAYYANE